ncbi:MAG: sulfur carrier protein ThiS [Lachnospiraceae bacterium]|nr:sulfur carrier protein ThiS [Robinsoniella sp.]MDY3765426.1 sulfur carrier protein ThiS [Lachnospiraceae bacterium]
MILKVAGEDKKYEEGLTLKELISLEEVQMPEYVTVSINDEFVEKENFDKTILSEGDVVEFLYFMGGRR